MFYKNYPNYRFQTFELNPGIAKKPFNQRNPLLFRTLYTAGSLAGFFLIYLNIYHGIRESHYIRNIYTYKKKRRQTAELFLAFPNTINTDPIENFSQF